MATWNEFRDFVAEHYTVMSSDEKRIVMGFNVSNGRTQTVFLWRQQLMGTEEWVQIESPIGEINKKTAEKAIRAAEHMVVGGIGCSGDLLTLRHAIPLENFDKNEFERPVILVTSTADRFEADIFGTDKF
jgi:hypothetical protein